MIACVLLGLLAAPPVFRTDVGLVFLQATVKNRRGELVRDLPKDAFRVYENGKPRSIDVFLSEDAPISLGILLDNSGSMRSKRAQVEAAALALVRASNPEDEVFVIDFADRVELHVPMTSDMARLESGVARMDSIGGTALRDAVVDGVSYLTTHAKHPRKALLVVTDGVDNASVASAAQSRLQAERHGVVVHAVGLLAPDDPKAAAARSELDELAELTGGVTYFPSGVENVTGAALALARQIRSQYTIGFAPGGARDGSYRKLRVEVKAREPLAVRTRPGYRIGSSAHAAEATKGAGR